jgi:DNA-binding NtrC family response regulator
MGFGAGGSAAPPYITTKAWRHAKTIASSARGDSLNESRELRTVLVVEDEPSIRNVLCVLLAGLRCEGDIVPSTSQALAIIEKRDFDAVLLDLRCSEMPATETVSALKNLRPSLVGKVLVITGDVSDPQTMEMIKKNHWPYIPRQRVMQELWDRLRSLLGFSPPPPDSSSRQSPSSHPPAGSAL